MTDHRLTADLKERFYRLLVRLHTADANYLEIARCHLAIYDTPALVARDEAGILTGAIRFWPVRVAGLPVLLLGPVAVHPTHQGEGLGAALIRDGLASARAAGWERVMLVGDAPYYGRFGFTLLEGVIMPPPTNPARVLGQELVPDAWAGVAGSVEHWNAHLH